MRLLVSLCAAVALVASSCGGDDSERAADFDPLSIAAGEGLVVRGLTGEIDLTISGAVEAAHRGPAPYQLTTQVGDQAPKSAWMLLLGLLDPITTDSGWKVRPAFDLIGYDGDGSYEIDPRGGGDVEPLERDSEGNVLDDQIGGALESAAIVVLEGPDTPITSFGDLLAPCQLQILDAGERGSIDCPRVNGPGGEMAVTWSWNTTGVLRQLEEGDDGSPVEVDPAPVAAPGGAGSTDAGPGSGAPEPEPLGPMDLEVALSTDCWQRGIEVVVTITTEPGAALAMLVAYNDARTYDQQRLGTADAQGRFIWRVIPTTDAPDGRGQLLVSGASSDGKRGNADNAEFELKLLCEEVAP